MEGQGLVAFTEPKLQEALLLFCDMISYSVLILTVWYKAPQVYAIIHSGSSEGISLPSLLLEFTSYSIEMTYQYAMGYPLISYIDIVFMWFQDVILVYTVLQNRDLIDQNIIPTLILYCVWFVLMVTGGIAEYLMFILIASTTVILTTSKSIQLWKVIATRHPGSLSALTWGLLSYMAFARIITTMVMTGDSLMLANTSSAFVLDVAVTAAILRYEKNDTHTRRPRRTNSRASR